MATAPVPPPAAPTPPPPPRLRTHSTTPLDRWTNDTLRLDFLSRMAARSQFPGSVVAKPADELRTPSVAPSTSPTSVIVHPATSVASGSTSVAQSVGPSSLVADTATELTVDDNNDITFSRRSSSDSSDAPPLTRGPSVASHDSGVSSLSGPPMSAVTELASFLSTYPLLEESDSNPGVLQLPETLRPPADYTCPFHILDCTETFEAPSLDLFKCHVMSHFRGISPPPHAKCPLCDAVFSTPPPTAKDGASGSRSRSDASARAWDSMLTHLASIHFRQGERLKTARPDFELYRYMWKKRLISDATYKSLQMEPARTGRNSERLDGRAVMHGAEIVIPPRAPSPPPAISNIGYRNEPFVAHMSRRDEQRARRRGRP